MAADNGQMSFRRGVMSLVILGLLKKEDMYGYQLVQETERRSGGRIVTQEGSLYPVLYKLVDQGLISDRKVLVGRRMRPAVVKITLSMLCGICPISVVRSSRVNRSS